MHILKKGAVLVAVLMAFSVMAFGGCTNPPTVDAGADQTLTCAQTSVTLDATVRGGTAPYTYEWTNSSGTVVGTTEDIAVSGGDTYTLAVAGANGCSASDSVTVTDDRGSIVTFPDSQVNESVHRELGKAIQERIYECDLANLTYLGTGTCGDGNDLTGLEHCTSLRELHIGPNGIGDFTPIEQLISLREFSIAGLDARDLSFLSQLQNLTTVYIMLGNMTDISTLLNLPNLTDVTIKWTDLDITCPESPARKVIAKLEARGVNVTWLPQENSAPDSTPPENPTVSSSSHQIGTPSSCDQVVISIADASDNCSIDGYEYAWDQNDSWTPSDTKTVDATWTGDTFTATNHGDWYFHIAAVDTSGNWSSPTTFGPIVLNTPPVANAGSDQTANEDTLVTIEGSATDADGDTIDSYQWTQVDGPDVELLGDDTAEVAFYAPDLLEEDQDITLQLVVRDSAGLESAPSSVTVTVTAASSQSGSDSTVVRRSKVPLSVSMESPQFLAEYRKKLPLWPSVSGGIPPYTYAWEDSEGTSLGDTIALTVSSAGDYSLTVTDSTGQSETSSVSVLDLRINPPNSCDSMVVDAGEDKTLTAQQPSATLTYSATPDEGQLVFWTDPQGAILDSTTPTVWAAGTYTVHVVNLRSNCLVTDSVEVKLDMHVDVTLDGPADGAENVRYWDSTLGWNITVDASSVVVPCVVLRMEREGHMGQPMYEILDKDADSWSPNEILQPDSTYEWTVMALSLPANHEKRYMNYLPLQSSVVGKSETRTFRTSSVFSGLSSDVPLDYMGQPLTDAEAYYIYWSAQGLSINTTLSQFLMDIYNSSRRKFRTDTITSALVKAAVSLLLKGVIGDTIESADMFMSSSFGSGVLKVISLPGLIDTWKKAGDFSKWNDARYALAAQIADTPLDVDGIGAIWEHGLLKSWSYNDHAVNVLAAFPRKKDVAQSIVDSTWSYWLSVPVFTREDIIRPVLNGIKYSNPPGVVQPPQLYNLQGDDLLDFQPHSTFYAVLYNNVPEVKKLVDSFYSTVQTFGFEETYGGIFLSSESLDVYRQGAIRFAQTIQDAVDASKLFIAKYTNQNHSPVVSMVHPGPTLTISSMTRMEFKIKAYDMDNDLDKCVWYLDDKRKTTSLHFSKEYTGMKEWGYSFTTEGIHTVKCEVYDKNGATSAVVWNVLVTPESSISTSPLEVHVTGGDKDIYAGEAAVLNINATDSQDALASAQIIVDGTAEAFIPLSEHRDSFVWRREFDKPKNRHLITVIVTDTADRKATTTCWVNVLEPMTSSYYVNAEEITPTPTYSSPIPYDAQIQFSAYAYTWRGNLTKVEWYIDDNLQDTQKLSGFDATSTWYHTFPFQERNLPDTVKAVFYASTGDSDYVKWDLSFVSAPICKGTPDTSNIITGVSVNTPQNFKVSATDRDGNLHYIVWSVDDSNVGNKEYFKNMKSETISRNFTFATPGFHTVTATVYDRDDGVATVSWMVSVSPEVPPQAPLTIERVSPSKLVSIKAGEEITFGIDVSTTGSSLSCVEWYIGGSETALEVHSVGGTGVTDSFTHAFLFGSDNRSVIALARDTEGNSAIIDWIVHIK